MTFVPPDLDSQLSALNPKDCPYCQIVWRYVPGIVRVHGIPMFSRTARSVVFHDPGCPLHGPTSAHGDD